MTENWSKILVQNRRESSHAAACNGIIFSRELKERTFEPKLAIWRRSDGSECTDNISYPLQSSQPQLSPINAEEKQHKAILELYQRLEKCDNEVTHHFKNDI